MLKWYDSSKTYKGVISKYKDLKIESELKTADKTLSVTIQEDLDITNECYIRTASDEYVVKEVSDTTGAFKQVVCALNLEELEAKAYKTFSVTNQTIENAARTALTGTGWTVAGSDVTKRRNAGMMKKSALGVLQGLCTAFMCEMSFDTINKTVTFYAERGSDRGVYFRDGINLKKLTAKSSSYDFYTRIIPYGADDLDIKSVNSGVEYVENHQYSSKNRTYIWVDTNYTDATALKEDAIAKLADMSKPTVSYSADIRDLAKLSTVYSLFQYGLGDTVTLTDSTTGIRDRQRIVKLTEYPQTPEKNTAELSNTFLTWEEMQAKEREAAAIIDAVISPDGTYNGAVKVSDILHWNEALESGIESSDYLGNYIQVTDGRIELVEASVGTIEANYITAEQVAATYATIATLEADYATIQNLSAVSADVQGLNARVASIETAYISTAQVNTLLADYTKTTDLVATYATITNLNATNGNVTNLTTRVATIEGAYITTARVNTLLAEYTKTSTLEATYATITDLHTNYATISLSNVTTENVKNLLVSNGIIKSATIVDGHITGTLDAITVNGVNIIAGTVVADRLVIRGTTQSVVYALNNYGQISSTQTNTIDGYILTQRTVNANRIVANSITASEIAANTITANEIAANTITGAQIAGTTLSGIFANIGEITAGILRSSDYVYGTGPYYCQEGMIINLNSKVIMTPKFSVINGVLRATDGIFSGAVYADTGTIGGWNIGSYQISQTDTMTEGVEADQYTIAVRGKNTDGTAATSNTLHFLVAKRHYTGSAYGDWASVFYVNHVGKLFASDADIRGKITADSGSIGGFSVSSAANQGTTANGGHYYANSLYVHSSGTESSTNYEYESGLTANSSASGAAAFYVRRIASGAAWSTATARFYVLNNGYLLATTGKIGPWTMSEASIYKGGGYQSATAGSAYFGDSGLSVTDKFYVTAAGEMYIKGNKIHLRNTSTDPSGFSIESPEGTARMTMTASYENAAILTSFPLTIRAESTDDVDYQGIGISSNYNVRIGGRKVILESETEITGNVTLSVATATSRALGVENSVGKVQLYMAGNGNMGIYDANNSKYLIYKNSSGQTFMSFVVNDTTSSAGNMFMGSTGRIYYGGGSSKRYKKEIKPLSDWKSVLDIPVVSFKYRDNYLSKEDQRYGVTVPGFIAEDVDEHYAVAADRVEGKVHDWNARYIIPPMLAVEQDHEKRIRELEDEIRRLKGEVA